jgi:N6-adenosine-specific RNA methylase IME4/ParB-like chromosome segregation protein Spo0J
MITSNGVAVHPAADLFPLMDAASFQQLKQDIAEHGQLEPVIFYRGKLLDGRHRWRACHELGIACKRATFQGRTDATAYRFVLSQNLHRRHLTASQRAALALDVLPLFEREAKQRQGSREDIRERIPESDKGKAAEKVAEMVGVNPRYISDAKRVAQLDPELFTRVRSGDITLPKAVIAVTHREAHAKLDAIARVRVAPPKRTYDVVVVDPPWPMQKLALDRAPRDVVFPYPTMSLEEIKALKLPLAADCHVWLWVTQRFLPDGFALLQSWGLRYVCQFTWKKPGGFQVFGLPQFNSEFVLYARCGSPTFKTTKGFVTCFDAPRGEHSEKPEVFYDMVRRVTSGRRLDMFSRRRIKGFDGWGQEAADEFRPVQFLGAKQQ